MKKVMSFIVNGEPKEVAVAVNTTLLEVLREELHLTGAKTGCNEGDCGACSVLLEDQLVASCTTLAAEADGKRITTIEGLAGKEGLHPVQQAFVDHFAIQCGFCTPGMVLAAVALLDENPDPTEEEIRDFLRGNICRCTGYSGIVRAIQAAKEQLKKDRNQEGKDVGI